MERSAKRRSPPRRTTRGIHKDDLAFDLGEHPIKKFGSQGQQKSFLIALRLSQLAYIEKPPASSPSCCWTTYDKIDDKRVQALMRWVTTGEFGQVFITDTDLGRIPGMFRETGADVRVYEVKAGTVRRADDVEANPLPSEHGAQ